MLVQPSAASLACRIEHAARVVSKDTGHWLMLDKPTEFASALRDVVQSIDSGRRCVVRFEHGYPFDESRS